MSTLDDGSAPGKGDKLDEGPYCANAVFWLRRWVKHTAAHDPVAELLEIFSGGRAAVAPIVRNIFPVAGVKIFKNIKTARPRASNKCSKVSI